LSRDLLAGDVLVHAVVFRRFVAHQ